MDLGGKDYNDGKGALAALLKDPAKAPLVRRLTTDKGEWEDDLRRVEREARRRRRQAEQERWGRPRRRCQPSAA